MKKILTSVSLCFLMYNQASACADSDTDSIYFNLFGQEIIQRPEYFPFCYLMTMHIMNRKAN